MFFKVLTILSVVAYVYGGNKAESYAEIKFIVENSQPIKVKVDQVRISRIMQRII